MTATVTEDRLLTDVRRALDELYLTAADLLNEEQCARHLELIRRVERRALEMGLAVAHGGEDGG